MRLHHIVLTLSPALTALALPAAANAHWRCVPLCPVPPARFEYRTVTRYREEVHIEYKEVQRTVCRTVPETVLQEVRETVLVPCWREETRQRTVMVPETHLESREREVQRTAWEL